MSKAFQITLMQTQSLPDTEGGAAPEWIHLLPGGDEVMTVDGRGPYRVADPQAIVAWAAGKKLPLDENHSIDLAARNGGEARARGYIVELQAREDGIWGRMDWTDSGRALMADRAYVGVSPAVVHDGQHRIIGIARASLTNKPNLRGLTALHMETDMDMSAVAKALGLAEDASLEAILTAIAGMKKTGGDEVALQSQMGEIGVALGVAADATPEAILAAAKASAKSEDAQVIVALQSELATVASRLNELTETGARTRAEGFIDGEIKRGRVGVKPLRDHYITRHMQDADAVEKEIGALPILGGGNTILPPKPVGDGEISLHSEQLAVARALGIDPKTYAATLKADNEEAL